MNEGLIYGSCDAFHQTIFNSRTQFGAEWKVYEFHGNVENFHPRFSFLLIFGQKPEIRAFCVDGEKISTTMDHWEFAFCLRFSHPRRVFIQSTFCVFIENFVGSMHSVVSRPIFHVSIPEIKNHNSDQKFH